LRAVEIHALFPARAQGLGYRRIGRQQRLALAGPVELVALLRPLDDAGCQFLPQQVEVDGLLQFALGVMRFGDASWGTTRPALAILASIRSGECIFSLSMGLSCIS
jgi:hypothetical protein